MKKGIILNLILVFSCNMIFAQGFFSSPFANTYSIVAFDEKTGDMGVAVQSHWFSVGTVVSWGEAGVGVIATQSFVNVSFGIRGLQLLKNGLSPQEVVDSLIKSDEGRDYRQLAVLDVKGRVAAYTGQKCIQEAGHITGNKYSVQANMMLNNTVWQAMSDSFSKSEGELAERLLLALEAAQAAGGDIRGKQSAAILVVRGKSTGNEWEDKLVDIRIDDNPEPLKELSRVLKVFRAYEKMNNGDLAVEKGDMQKAMLEYQTAEEMFPENEEMKYWHAVTLVNNGGLQPALLIFKEIFRKNLNWKILTPRLIKSGLLNVNQEQLNLILEQ